MCRIWEKKYGRFANHVKKKRDDSIRKPLPGGRKGLPDQPHAQFQNGHGHSHGRKVASNSRSDGGKTGPGRPAFNTQSKYDRPAVEKAIKDDRPLHPSWSAKRHANAKEGNLISTVPAGKKIKFD